MNNPTTPPTERLFTFRSGGWVLLMAGVFTVGIMVWALASAFLRTGGPLVGDGRNVASYGFDLTPCLVESDLLVAGGLRKDALKALVDPPVIPGTDVARINQEERGKYLVSRDRVIGVEINGETRAYPVTILNVHEIVNDTVGGVPIAVTYNPPCDAVAVFDRRAGDEVLEFGVSGLLYNSNLLMYDRRPDAAGESLWSQLLAKAVTGPAAARGATLRRLPCTLVGWGDWLRLHPETTVLQRDYRLAKRYKETNYGSYFRSADIKFPVRPMPGPDDPPAKGRVIVVRTRDGEQMYTYASIAEQATAAGVWGDRVGTTDLIFNFRQEPGTVRVASNPPDAIESVTYCLWFAANAMQAHD